MIGWECILRLDCSLGCFGVSNKESSTGDCSASMGEKVVREVSLRRV